jgi:hypothetical protein
LKDTAIRLLNGRLNLAAVVCPSHTRSLHIEKEDLLRWFESEQALVWSKEVSLIHERSKTTAQEPHRAVGRVHERSKTTAQEPHRAVGWVHERSKATAQEPHRGAFERLISGNY